jgi:hypothetical protein
MKQDQLGPTRCCVLHMGFCEGIGYAQWLEERGFVERLKRRDEYTALWFADEVYRLGIVMVGGSRCEFVAAEVWLSVTVANANHSIRVLRCAGTPERARTSDPKIRNLVLCPTELPGCSGLGSDDGGFAAGPSSRDSDSRDSVALGRAAD